MNFEFMQQAWQRQPLPAVSANAAELLATVKASAAKFDRTIRWRDTREILAALFCALVFGTIALWRARHGLVGWADAATAIWSLVLVVIFLRDRREQARRAAGFGTTLREEVARALYLTEHQVHLLRNVFAWYLAPFLVAMLFLHLQRYGALPAGAWLLAVAKRWAFDWLLAGFIYWLNQRAVQRKLLPRVAELQRMQEDLQAFDRP